MAMIKRRNPSGKFSVRDEHGNRETLYTFVDIIAVGNFADPEGMMSTVTRDGHPVLRLDSDRFQDIISGKIWTIIKSKTPVSDPAPDDPARIGRG